MRRSLGASFGVDCDSLSESSIMKMDVCQENVNSHCNICLLVHVMIIFKQIIRRQLAVTVYILG